MIPLFFGPSDRALWGVYHPAAGAGSRTGLVICCPVDEQEYFNVHRTCRLLAEKLAGAGVHVLRFDYLGTGDSAGEPDDLGPDEWREDITLAVEELQDLADLRTVGLIGLRTGAALALDAAGDVAQVTRLGLWGPLVDEEPGAGDPVPTVTSILSRRSGSVHLDVLLLSNGDRADPGDRLTSALEERYASFRHVHHEEVGPQAGSPGSALAIASVATLVDWARPT